MCKNWEFKGTCKWGDKCSYAHGEKELQEKKHLHSNYRTKQCRQFHSLGYCFYGKRCQYVHFQPETSDQLATRFEKTTTLLAECLFEEKSFAPSALISEAAEQPDATMDQLLARSERPNRRRLPLFEAWTVTKL
eukprot:TRINITY_DN1802_c0_g1_i3.p1 TRINITY_DN1802_c0_g1~~TRINITY_DN1802_c0_g1_i3.p1  ORF type:complete len:134 (-),score=22.78 TRINITY_DN1802_c0_g1_i3:115-516(-)